VPEREDLFAYYAGQDEGQRLFRFPHNRLELLRTRELLQRRLPSPPAVVLDVGGATGVHAAWLAGRGYRVHLVDRVPAHVRAALEHGHLTAEVGDARQLTQADASVDAVLMLGPLYHLVVRAERIAALAEARRVVRPGGILLAAAIGRFMAVLDWAQSGGLTADVAAKLLAVLSTGVHDPPSDSPTPSSTPPLSCGRRWRRPGSPMYVSWGLRGPRGLSSMRPVKTQTRRSIAPCAAPS
jgi:SAM-dependent methyltransferase